MSEETLDEKYERLERAKAAREAKREDASRLRQVEALELEERFEQELGPRGVKFDIVSNDVGNFVVKLGEFVAHKRFNAKGGNVTEEDIFALVLPCIVWPATREEAAATLRQHAGIAWDCALAMQGLYRAKREADRGK